jgi:two-component system, OmpR family, response regulator VicR
MSPNYRILVADSDYIFSHSIKTELQNNGFNTTVCFDGEAVMKKIYHRNEYDLCLLNYILPKQTGFEILTKMRHTNTLLPILFVSDVLADADMITAFKHGADGWMNKPISTRELICRISVFIRRSGASSFNGDTKIKIGKSVMDFEENILTDIDGNEIKSVTKKTAKVLKYLCQKPNTLIPRDELLYACWGKVDRFNGRSMDVFTLRIRQLFDHDHTVNLETIHNVGFRLNMPIDKINITDKADKHI